MTKTLFVGNLPWNVESSELLQVFTEHGGAEVISARVITDRETGRSRGFGFVEVPADKAEAVIEAMNNAQLSGRTIVVNEAKAREPMDRNSRGRN
ncbi:MAG: RNA recognition motif domain-containing protein [Sulfobacillus sp.]